jgi:acetylornithine/succinyldiaminopimelate/putrescine aminotransferase
MSIAEESLNSSFIPVSRSLADMLGEEYVEAVSRARTIFTDEDALQVVAEASEQIDFYPASMSDSLARMLEKVGSPVLSEPLKNSPGGASSAMFNKSTKCAAAPLSAYGYYRIGEDGHLYLITKSEHYHTPLGHSFPGYRLIDAARKLGVPNATHNNTRGYITRRLEEELIRTANGLERDNQTGLADILAKTDDLFTLNRVLNLETGSLAVEAALKMLLARFYRMQPDMSTPKYTGRTPVILVMGNDEGGLQANYHGTTTLTQIMRGMWPELNDKLSAAEMWKIVPIRPNSIADLDAAFEQYDHGSYKIAGFFHEIIMMNYGGRRLSPEFLQHAYAQCRKHDVPTMADEIQSCMWAPQLYLFREYGLTPSCVAIGKGFPGGEYPASRIIFSSALDVMPQFGALVTNGQEELAALAYLITMEWAQANNAVTARLGAYFERALCKMADDFSELISGSEGWHHMTTLCFKNLDQANAFVKELTARGMEFSAQTYKTDCPPVVLCKLPLIADRTMIDFVSETMREVLSGLNAPHGR